MHQDKYRFCSQTGGIGDFSLTGTRKYGILPPVSKQALNVFLDDANFIQASSNHSRCTGQKETILNSLLPYFAQVPVLASLPNETQKRLERVAEQRHYRRCQVIHFSDQPGDFLFLLCSGRVKISRVSDQGREVTLYLIEDCQLFGETGLLEANRPYELMAETLDDLLICVFRRGDILAALQETPQAMLEMLKLVGARRADVETQVADLVFLEVPKRLAKLLLHLEELHGSKTSRGGMLIKAKFTHQELANMIGSTRETTTLILNDFKRQGYIDFLGRKLIVRDRASLEAPPAARRPRFGKIAKSTLDGGCPASGIRFCAATRYTVGDMELYLVRHGESQANAGLSDHLDSHLTALGQRQAERTAQRLGSEGLTQAYVSPLRRTLQRSPRSAPRRDCPRKFTRTSANTSGQIIRSSGRLKGCRPRPSAPSSRSRLSVTPSPAMRFGGRSSSRAIRFMYARAERVRDALLRLYAATEARILIVTHAETVGRLVEAFLRVPPEPGAPPWSDNCGISRLRCAPDSTAATLLSLNYFAPARAKRRCGLTGPWSCGTWPAAARKRRRSLKPGR